MKKIYLAIPLLLLGCTDSNFNYPASEKKPLSYEAHGETINDPYLYMEECQNLEVIAWLINRMPLLITTKMLLNMMNSINKSQRPIHLNTIL